MNSWLRFTSVLIFDFRWQEYGCIWVWGCRRNSSNSRDVFSQIVNMTINNWKIENPSVPVSELSCCVSARERWVYWWGQKATSIEAAERTAVTAAWRELQNTKTQNRCHKIHLLRVVYRLYHIVLLFWWNQNQCRAQRSRLCYLAKISYC